MMTKDYFIPFIIFFIVGAFKVDEIQAENRGTIFSSETSRSFSPFNMNSWFNLPSQFIQYWFPLFRPAYYPSYLQKPSTTTKSTLVTPATPPTASKNQTEKTTQNSNSKTDNIFGIHGSADETIEYLPAPSEIEW